MKRYEKPEFLKVEFDVEDVITTSIPVIPTQPPVPDDDEENGTIWA